MGKREAGCRIDHTTVFRHPARDGEGIEAEDASGGGKIRQPALFLFQHTKTTKIRLSELKILIMHGERIPGFRVTPASEKTDI